MRSLILGAYDLHVHTAPDIVPRKCSDIDLAQRLIAAGMKGMAIKCHCNDTAARAVLLQKQYPQLHIVGGLTLNRAVGGLNPVAVECSAKMGGRMLWFPTTDALAYQTFYHPNEIGSNAATLLSVCGEHGHLVPTVFEILDLAQQYRLVVGTGHLSPQEGLAVVEAAALRKVKTVLTHADNPATRYSLAQMQQAVALGAMVEFCYLTILRNRTAIEMIARYIHILGSENVLLSTDLGQPESPFCDEGLALFGNALAAQGCTPQSLAQMLLHNPRQLILGADANHH